MSKKVINPPAPFVFMDLRSTVLARDEEAFLNHRLLAGIVLFAKNYENPEQLAQLLQQVRDINPKLMFAIDQEGGRVQRFQLPFTSLPAMQRLGDLYLMDNARALQLAKNCAWLVGNELSAFGIHINFAPVLDLNLGCNHVIGDRAFSKQASVVTAMANAYFDGMAETEVLAVAKHFPGHGGAALDSHVDQPVDQRSFEQLWAGDLLPYRELAAQIPAVMCSHVIYPEVSPMPAGYCAIWLQDILRTRLQSKALVFSDCLGMKAAQVAGPPEKRIYLSRLSGCDYAVMCYQTGNFANLLDAVEEEIASHPALNPSDSFHSLLSVPSSTSECLQRWTKLQASEKYCKVRYELEHLC